MPSIARKSPALRPGKGSSVDALGVTVFMTLPKAKDAEHTDAFGAIVQKLTIVPAVTEIEAVTRHGSHFVHAADARGTHSLCNSPLDPVPGSSRDQEKALRKRLAQGEEALDRVKCKFCEVRLVGAALILPEEARSTYGQVFGRIALDARLSKEAAQAAAQAAALEAAHAAALAEEAAARAAATPAPQEAAPAATKRAPRAPRKPRGARKS